MSGTAAVGKLFGKKILGGSFVQVNRAFKTCPGLYFSSNQKATPRLLERFICNRLDQTQVRLFMLSSSRLSEGSSEQFKEAVKNLGGVKDADNQTKLKLYALYKQATVGKNNTKKPGMLDMVGKAKWDAWSSLGDITKAEAEKSYVDIVNSMLGQSSKKAEETSEESDGLLITVKNGVKTIKMNRPAKKNALNMEMYRKIAAALKESNDEDNVNVIVLTGSGDFFCSGNDLANFMNVTDPQAMAKTAKEFLLTYVASYIDVKKPLVALINGPAVKIPFYSIMFGIAVTVLGLCDAVFATDRATFTTPFSSLGQSPESLIYSKELVRGRERQLLHEVNRMECERLEERWVSEDCINAIMKFFSKKSKM